MAKDFSLIKRAESGFYTPTFFETTNLDDSTPAEWMYIRVGVLVHVSGRFEADATGAGNVLLGASLPIPSNFTGTLDAAGVAASGSGTTGSGRVVADPTNDRVSIIWVATNTDNRIFSVTFTYRIR